MTTADVSVARKRVHTYIRNGILATVGIVVFSVANWYLRTFVASLVIPLGVLALIVTLIVALTAGFRLLSRELMQISANAQAAERMAANAAEMSTNAALELNQLRIELESINAARRTSPAGFFVAPDAPPTAAINPLQGDQS